MDDQTLSRVVESDPFLKKLIIGIYSQDRIPSKIPLGKGIIINTLNEGQHEERDEAGNQLVGHWFCILNLKKSNIYLLDSCLTKLSKLPNVKKMLIRCKKPIYKFPFKLQDCHNTDVCGSYVIFFIYMASRGFSPPEMLSHFFANGRMTPFKRDYFISNLIPSLLPAVKTSPLDLLYDRERFSSKNE